MSSEKKEIGRFFKHSYIYAIGNLLNRIDAFLLLPIYTNYLNTSEYGALELFYGISSVVFGLLSMGIAHATLRFYFEYKESKQQNLVVSTNYIAAMFISILGALFVANWSGELSNLVFSTSIYANGIYIILGTMIFELSSQVCLAYVRAIEHSMFFIYIALVKLVIQVCLNIYFVMFAEMGVIGILIGNFVAVFLGWLVLSYFTILRIGIGFDRKKLIMILKYSFPFLLGTITALVSTNIDKFTLNSLAAVGIYMLAMKFGMLIEQLIGEPFSRSYGSFRFSIMKDKNAPMIQANITKYLFYFALFIALALSILIKDFLTLISDEQFRPAAMFVPVILLASLLKILNYPMQTGILYKKKTKYIFYISGVSALVSVIGNLSLIPLIGIWGACITLIATNLVSIIMTHLRSQKYFSVEYPFCKMLQAFALAIVFFLIATQISVSWFWLAIILKLTLIICYSLILLKSRFFLEQQEKITLNRFISNKVKFLNN